MFYDKGLDVYKNGDGYLNDDGIWIDGQEQFLKTIECDIQPYSSELLYADYGYRIQCTKRIFCDLDNELEEGMIIEYKDKKFKIVKMVEWDDYMEVVIDNE